MGDLISKGLTKSPCVTSAIDHFSLNHDLKLVDYLHCETPFVGCFHRYPLAALPRSVKVFLAMTVAIFKR
jgi:hypothetical protein